MTTPAEALLENSTLQSGTPWEHLNAQAGGSGGSIILKDGLVLIMDDCAYDIEIILEEYELEVDMGELLLECDTNEYEVELNGCYSG